MLARRTQSGLGTLRGPAPPRRQEFILADDAGLSNHHTRAVYILARSERKGNNGGQTNGVPIMPGPAGNPVKLPKSPCEPKVNPRDVHHASTGPIPDQRRSNTGAVRSPPACGSEALRSIQDTLAGDSGQSVFAACGALSNRGCGSGSPPANRPRSQVNTPRPNQVCYY